MMRSTFGGLEVAKRALFAMQTTQQTTAHNIANANTKGYTRQVVNLVASRPIEAPGLMRSNIPGQLGQGVHFDSINRIREKFLDDQFYNESKSLGEWSVRVDTLEKLEVLINEPSDTGIRQTIENFWNAWQELTREPDNVTIRTSLKERALGLTDTFNHIARKLEDLSADLTDNLNIKALQADSILSQVVSLNTEIYRVEGLGNNANDLRDQRDVLIDELSQLMNLSVTEDSQGYTVRMGSTELISGNAKNVVIDAGFLESSFQNDLDSGEIYGLIMSRDHDVAHYMDELNELAATLANGQIEVTLPAGMMLPDGMTVNDLDNNSYSGTLTESVTVIVNGINGLHRLGYTMEDEPGGDFFVVSAGNEALSFSLHPDIEANVSLIAASGRTYVDELGNTKVVQGNNQLALIMAGLRNNRFPFNNGDQMATIDEYFRSMVGKLGVDTQEAIRHETNQLILVEQIEYRRQSVSGVSLDEEMSNMIMYQHSYNAAARILTTFDEMLDRVINNMGIVGR